MYRNDICEDIPKDQNLRFRHNSVHLDNQNSMYNNAFHDYYFSGALPTTSLCPCLSLAHLNPDISLPPALSVPSPPPLLLDC